MKQFNRTNLLDRAQRRLRRARPGTVLILVVALLILMAIIGTAYMSMAQSDRATAATHTNNTEIDMLLDGVVSMLRGSIVSELYAGAGTFRNGQQNPTSTGYNNWNGVGLDSFSTDASQVPGGKYLGSRSPDVVNTLAAAARTTNDPFWPFVTAPLSGTQFSTPYWNPTAVPFLAGMGTAAPLDPYHYTQRDSYRVALGAYTNQLIPGFVQLAGGQYYPAWVDSAHPLNPNFAILAADTDGDGIADAGYFKLPIGAINGVTYYAAVRIIDNAAAININTAAWPNATNVGSATDLIGDYFPNSIYLQRLLHPQDSLTVNPGTSPSLFTYLTNGIFAPYPLIDDTGTFRNDYTFVPDPQSTGTVPTPPGQDRFWNQLGRRIENPAIVGVSAGAPVYFHPLSISDSITFARNFVLRDFSGSSPSVGESALPNTLFNYSARLPYTASDQPTANGMATTWFANNFTYFSAGPTDKLAPDITNPNLNTQTESALALLVSRNPVSNFAPNKFNRVIPGNIGPTVGFGDQVELNGRAYVYIGPPWVTGLNVPPLYSGPAAAPTFLPFPSATNPGYNSSLFWVPEPWADTPTKINANTATFGQLYTAYWAAMVDFSNRDTASGFLGLDGKTVPPAGARERKCDSSLTRSEIPLSEHTALPSPQFLIPKPIRYKAALPAG